MKISIKRNLKRRHNFNSKERSVQYLQWSMFSMMHKMRTQPSLVLQRKYKHPIFQSRVALMLQKADFSIAKIKNTCYISRRNRGVSRAFRLSRQTFKEQVNSHYFPGVTRFSVKG